MPEMFSRSEMQQIVDSFIDPLPLNNQLKICHEGCPAGTDRKKRLYVKNNGEGVLMYCHHCGSKGFLRTSDKLRRVDELFSTDVVTHTTTDSSAVDLWHSADTDMADWPVEARLWWYSYELDQVDALVYGAKWSDAAGRLLLRATPNIYQGRAFGAATPKYLTWKNAWDVVLFQQSASNQPRVIIVEDLVSAYKLHKAGCDVVCLLGTKASEQDINAIARYDKALIWLDSDTAGIMGSGVLYARLSAIIKCENFTKQQPKELPISYLRGIADA